MRAAAIPLGVVVGVVMILAGVVARAQTQPPAAGFQAPPPATALPAQAQPPAPTPPPPPDAPPPGGVSPIMSPDPSQPAPQLMLAEQPVAMQQPPPDPFYRKIWFWGAVGVVVLTVAVILIAGSGSSGPATPTTTFGNMDAF